MTLIPAYRKDEALLLDIKNQMGIDEQIHIWWLGQSGFLLQWKRQHILLDPYLSDSLTKKYQGTDKEHIRMSERVIDPAHLNFIDIVTSSHNHTDHLDAETLIPLFKVNPNLKMLIPEANRSFVCDRVQLEKNIPFGINAGETLDIQNIRFHGIASAHNDLDKDIQGRHLYMGYVIEIGNKKIYHSGDTLKYEGLDEFLKIFQIDLALLPINGNLPERKVAGNMNAKEAVSLSKIITAKWTIPCHYDMFTFNTVDVNEFITEAEKEKIHFRILKIGERFSI
ncbi:MAG: MBL fold metallo-hydrolase [Chitinophagaceae bacterium]